MYGFIFLSKALVLSLDFKNAAFIVTRYDILKYYIPPIVVM